MNPDTSSTFIDAQYTPATLECFRGNPLIETLPNFVNKSTVEIGDLLCSMPKSVPSDFPSGNRADWLIALTDRFFMPFSRHIELFRIVDLMIRHGYSHRNPQLPRGAQYYKDLDARFKAGEENSEWREGLSASIVGCPGTGKTRSICQILDLYPKVYRHDKLWTGTQLLQIVHLRVECPPTGSMKALCSEIIRRIGDAVGADYAAEFIRPRATVESLKAAAIRLMSMHCLGLLVIDEMQNLVSQRKDREDLFNFIVNLSNTLSVPILFVGTYRLESFMTTTMRTGRRFGSLGSFRWEPLKHDHKDWRTLTRALWQTVVLRDVEAEMPDEVEETLYDLTQGVPDILIKLVILTQLRVLACAESEDITSERLTSKALKRVFADHFSHMKPFVDAIRSNDRVRLESFEDIALKNQELFTQGASSLLGDIHEFGEIEKPEQATARLLNNLRQITTQRLGEEIPEALQTLVEKIIHAGANKKLLDQLDEVIKRQNQKAPDDDQGLCRNLESKEEISAGQLEKIQ